MTYTILQLATLALLLLLILRCLRVFPDGKLPLGGNEQSEFTIVFGIAMILISVGWLIGFY